MSHIHFAATEKSAERIKKMGEKNVYVVGAPGIETILNEKLSDKKEIYETFHLDPKKKTVLILQHPVTMEFEKSSEQIKNTLDAVRELNLQGIIIYPNSDAGGRKMIKVIQKYDFVKEKNIEHKHFLSLIKHVDVMVGNSSSGIIEAASFGTAVVNIGTRQEGRERNKNIIEVSYEKEKIKNAILDSLKKEYPCKNIYGDGETSDKVIKIINKTELNKIIQKRLKT